MQSRRRQAQLPTDRSPIFPDADRLSKYRVHVCRGPNCSARNSKATLACFEEAVRNAGLSGEVEIIATSCRDRCDWGPSVNIFPGPTMYAGVDCSAVRKIVEQHLAQDKPVANLKFDPSKPGRSR
jgi:(2Fe-2S) ferredoxin